MSAAASEAAATRLKKPNLRGTMMKQTVMNLMIAIACAATAAITTKVVLGDWRKKKYADFYKNYDAMADFDRMQAAGVLSSAPPGGGGSSKDKDKK